MTDLNIILGTLKADFCKSWDAFLWAWSIGPSENTLLSVSGEIDVYLFFYDQNRSNFMNLMLLFDNRVSLEKMINQNIL